MKKVLGNFDILIKTTCPYCGDLQNHNIDILEKNNIGILNSIESIIRGIVKRYAYGTTDISETVVNCLKCRRQYIINNIDR